MTMTAEEATTASRQELVDELNRAGEALATRKHEILAAIEAYTTRLGWAHHVVDTLMINGGLRQASAGQPAPVNPDFFTDPGLRAQLELRRAEMAAAEEKVRQAIALLAWQGYYNRTTANGLLEAIGLRQITEVRTWTVSLRSGTARWTTTTEPARTPAEQDRLRAVVAEALKAALGDSAGDVTWAGMPELNASSSARWDVEGIVY